MSILEAIKAGKEVQTRDGRKVRILCTNLKSLYFPIAAAVTNGEEENIICYTKNGTFYINETTNANDLVVKPMKVTRWVNVYINAIGTVFTDSIAYNSKDEAEREKDPYIRIKYLGAKPIEIEI